MPTRPNPPRATCQTEHIKRHNTTTLANKNSIKGLIPSGRVGDMQARPLGTRQTVGRGWLYWLFTLEARKEHIVENALTEALDISQRDNVNV